MTVARGTPFEALFASLTERMGVLHTSSPDDDGSNKDRVEWTLVNFEGNQTIGYSIPGTVTIGRQALEYDVHIHGASELEVLQRARELAGWLDFFVGPPQGAPPPAGNGYKVGKTSKPVRGSDGLSASWGCVMQVTLYEPVFSEVRPILLVGQVNVTTTAQADASTSDGVMTSQAG